MIITLISMTPQVISFLNIIFVILREKSKINQLNNLCTGQTSSDMEMIFLEQDLILLFCKSTLKAEV